MVIMTCAVAEDIKSYRISNRLVLTGLCAGLTYSMLSGGAEGISRSILAALLPIVLLFPIYLMRGIGAGDVKLLAAAGSYLTFGQSFTCLIAAILFGGVYSFYQLIKGEKTIHMSIPIFLSVFFVMEGII